MNEEIKEILDRLKDDIYVPLEDNREYKLLDKGDDTALLDYITNLQAIEQEHQRINGELREENKKLKDRIHALEKHNQKLQLEAQKYFDMLMESEYGEGDKE